MDFSQPQVMGILNITPDSFSDGARFSEPASATAQLKKLIADGADIIDIGGESTGPGSPDVSVDEELKRVKPVIDYIHTQKLTDQVIFSIDTYKSRVAEYALAHGFAMVNDVTALRGDPNILKLLATRQPYVILMCSKDPTPRTTKKSVEYGDVIAAIKTFLSERIAMLIKAGFPKDKIIIDPGMGAFVSADPKYSYEIIDRLGELKTLGYPICVGPSRKSFLGGDISARDAKSWVIAKKALKNGASIIRMHQIKLS
ncbi:MAG: dihydropteroate synthase [Candidatus Peregrinibacteria bacterium]